MSEPTIDAATEADLQTACLTSNNFCEFFRKVQRPNIGDHADDITTEQKVLTDLSEDGWPDSYLWLRLWNVCHAGHFLSPTLRRKAIEYWRAGEDDPPDQYILTEEEVQDAETQLLDDNLDVGDV